MPNIKSAAKRMKVAERKTLANKTQRSAMRTAIKRANEAIEGGSADKDVVVKAAVVKIDKAVSKGLIHKNNAARKKSALTLKLNAK